MHRPIVAIAILAVPCACVGTGRSRLSAAPQPAALSIPHADVLHGVEVPDPYRWLEESGAPEVEAWVTGEAALAREVLDSLPGRKALQKRLVELARIESRSLPVTHGAWSYWLENDGTRDQPRLVRGRSIGRAEEVVLDPYEAVGDAGALVDLAFSPHGSFVAFGLSQGGSDWVEWRVRDLETLVDCGPGIRRVRYNRPAWTNDEAGFFYGGYAPSGDPVRQSAERMRLAYHRIGEPQSADELVHDDPQSPRRGYAPEVTEDGRWLVVTVWEGAASRNRLYVRDLSVSGSRLLPLFDDLDAAYHLVGSRGASLFLRTTAGAPTGRIVRVDAPGTGTPWVEVVPAAAVPLADALCVGEHLVVEKLDDGWSVLEVFTLGGECLGTVSLPGRGSVGALRRSAGEDAVLVSYSAPMRPAEHWRVEVPSRSSERIWAPAVPFDGARFTATRIGCTSSDGTEVPVWLVHALAGAPTEMPVVLTGYGGFGVVPRHAFDPAVAAWLERGGGYAVAHVRGGGEFGESWHLAATGANKRRSFEDFTAAAEALVENGWTRPSRLGARGASNGGLLVAASLNLRPDLFGAAVPAVGVFDMLRYHRFTVGWSWAGDFGTVDDPDVFPALLAYSPYHNVQLDVRYPPVLVLAAAGDDRVVPLHSFKYVAALRGAVRAAGGGPALLRVAAGQGHSSTSAAESFAAAVDEWTFFGAALGSSR